AGTAVVRVLRDRPRAVQEPAPLTEGLRAVSPPTTSARNLSETRQTFGSRTRYRFRYPRSQRLHDEAETTFFGGRSPIERERLAGRASGRSPRRPTRRSTQTPVPANGPDGD